MGMDEKNVQKTKILSLLLIANEICLIYNVFGIIPLTRVGKDLYQTVIDHV